MTGIDWQTVRRVVVAGWLAVLWFAVAPFAFLTLYYTLQVQAAAREVIPEGGVPTLTIAATARQIEALEKDRGVLQHKLSSLNDKETKDHLDYVIARNQFVDDLITIGSLARVAFDPARCRAVDGGVSGRDAAFVCHDLILPQVLARLGGMKPEDRAVLSPRIDVIQQEFSAFLRFSETSQSQRDEMKTLSAALVANDQATKALTLGEGEKVYRVVRLYREAEKRASWFPQVFLVPDGVAISTFTGVMGAIGAAVYSLFLSVRRRAAAADGERDTMVRSYLTRPLLGALAGFMVYFVLSAGASVLLSREGASEAAAVSLSPAALASLGLLAGMAAENAMLWLAENASKLFKT